MGTCSPEYEACMVGCMGRISDRNLKIRMVISRIATVKNHIELLDLGQIWDRKIDFQNFRNRSFLDDAQGELCEGTVQLHLSKKR
jgi:hypothetical protein